MVVFINQIRQKIGVMFGNGEVTTGGNALKFYASVRLEIRRIGAIKKGDAIIGNKTKIKIVKNKLAPPFRVVETEIRYGDGICPAVDLLLMAESLGVVSKSGSWYALGDTRLGQGKEAVREKLLEDTELLERLRTLVRGAAGFTPVAAAA